MTHHQPAFEQLAAIYRFCAQSMIYPSKEWFTGIYINSLYSFLEVLGGQEEIDKLQKMFTDEEDSLETLQVEYTRLFITGVPHVIAPPYASVYIDKSLRGKYSEEILKFYQLSGFTLNKHADLPDNIVHQLEFLSLLTEDGNQKAEEEFIRLFFLPWFPVFASRVRKEAELPFYPVIVSIIEFFTKEEEEYGV